jgi:hypothetical protein
VRNASFLLSPFPEGFLSQGRSYRRTEKQVSLIFDNA